MGMGEGGVGGNPKPSSGDLSTNIDLYYMAFRPARIFRYDESRCEQRQGNRAGKERALAEGIR